MARLEGRTEGLTDVDLDLVRRARQFVAEHVASHASRWELDRRVPTETFALAAQQGLALMLQPEKEARADVPSYLGVARVAEEMGAGCLTFALPLLAQNYVAWAVARHGTLEARSSLLPQMRAGSLFGGFCLTEPGAGSDVAALATTARRVGGKWTITGEKAWVLLGTEARFFIVFAKAKGADGSVGVGLYLVRAGLPGVEIGDAYAMVGGHALGCNSVRFWDVEVSDEDMLLPPGQGFSFAFDAIDFARLYVAATACGMLRAGLEEALQYTTGRMAFGQRIVDFQGPQWMLADVATHLLASRALVDEAVTCVSDRARFTPAVAHAKKFVTQVALPGLATCAQLLGANGLLARNASGRHFQCAKIAQYLDGSTEIQNLVIARSLMRTI